jgi:hypothetical protein
MELGKLFQTFQDSVVVASSKFALFFLDTFIFKLRPLHGLEMLGTVYPISWCHIPEEWNPWVEHCENLKTFESCISFMQLKKL